jgi:hypothetical protein
MDPIAFAALLERCAPGAPHEPLTAIVRQVSSFEPFLITIDGRKPIHLQATSREEAIRLTMEATATGQSVRVGLAQLGPEDLKQVGLTISAAFDTCKHVAAVGRLLNVRLQAAGANGRDPDTATMSAIGSFTAMPAPAPLRRAKRPRSLLPTKSLPTDPRRMTHLPRNAQPGMSIARNAAIPFSSTIAEESRSFHPLYHRDVADPAATSTRSRT